MSVKKSLPKNAQVKKIIFILKFNYWVKLPRRTMRHQSAYSQCTDLQAFGTQLAILIVGKWLGLVLNENQE